MELYAKKKNQIVRHLLQIGTFLQKTGERLTREFGLTLHQFLVLNEVTEKGPINQKQVVGKLLFEKSNVSKIVSHLHAAGLVHSKTASDDARSKILIVTQNGKLLRNQCMKRLISWNVNWLESLSDDDIAMADMTLEKLVCLTR